MDIIRKLGGWAAFLSLADQQRDAFLNHYRNTPQYQDYFTTAQGWVPVYIKPTEHLPRSLPDGAVTIGRAAMPNAMRPLGPWEIIMPFAEPPTLAIVPGRLLLTPTIQEPH